MKNPLLAGADRLSDKALLQHVKQLAKNERGATVSLVAHLAVLDARKLYLGEGFSCLHDYCVAVLHLSDDAAYFRIRAARVASEYPVVLDRLASGELTLSTLKLLAPELTPETHRELLDAARFKTKQVVEKIVVARRPRPVVGATIFRLPARVAQGGSNGNGAAGAPAVGVQAGSASAVGVPVLDLVAPESAASESTGFPGVELVTIPASQRDEIVPLGPDSYRFHFTASAEMHTKFRHAQALLRHSIPKGDAGAILDRALTLLVRHLEKSRLAATDRPRNGSPPRSDSRHVPNAVKRQVWARDGGRCTFTSADGRRCSETGFLELDHVQPVAAGGETSFENLRLLCRAHNRHAADEFFGTEEMQRRVDAARQRRAQGGEVRKAGFGKRASESEAPPRKGSVNRERGDDSGGLPLRETAWTYSASMRPAQPAGWMVARARDS